MAWGTAVGGGGVLVGSKGVAVAVGIVVAVGKETAVSPIVVGNMIGVELGWAMGWAVAKGVGNGAKTAVGRLA